MGSQKALNAYFPMPFRKSAKTTVTNEGEEPIRAFYYNIDWQRHRGSFDRVELQDWLESKAEEGLSHSTIDHLRWDLSQILRWRRRKVASADRRRRFCSRPERPELRHNGE